MKIQIALRCLIGMAVASSIISTPLANAAQPKTNPTQTAPVKIDPHWRALIEEVDQAAAPHQSAHGQAFAPTVHFNLSIGMLSGRVDQPDPLTIQFRRGNAVVLNYTIAPMFDGNGYAFLDATLGSSSFFHAVDQLELSQANQTVSISIPTLIGLMNTEDDIVSGYVTSYTLVHVQATAFNTPTLSVNQAVSVTANHLFTANLSGLMDVRPRDYGFVWVDVDSRTHLYASMIAPLVQVEAGGSIIASSTGFIGGGRIDMTDASNHLLTQQMIAPLGPPMSFVLPLTLTLNEGDHVIASTGGIDSQTVVTIPKLSVHADADGTHLFGDAPANTQVELRGFAGPITDEQSSILGSRQPITHVIADVNAQGLYSAPLALPAGGYAFVIYITPNGHEVFARYVKPYIRAGLGHFFSSYLQTTGYSVVGQFNHFQQPITIVVQGPSGYPKIERHITGLSSGYFYDGIAYAPPNALVAIDSGDVVTVSTEAGDSRALHVPEFTVAADRSEYAVFGNAPPNARVTIRVPYFYPFDPTLNQAQTQSPQTVVPPYWPAYLLTKAITVSANGTFSVSLPELAQHGESLIGEAELELSDGNAVVRPFTEQSLCRPYVNQVDIGGNSIILSNAFCSSNHFRAQVRSSDGQLKWSGVDLSQNVLLLTKTPNAFDKPLPIASGDQIQITQGDYLNVVTVPTLTIKLNPEDNSLGGTTTPNMTVTVSVASAQPIPFVADPYTNAYITETVADGTGNYRIVLGTELTLTAGSLATAHIVENRMNVAASDSLPVLYVFPSTFGMRGRLKPYTPYTVSVTAEGAPPTSTFESPIVYANNNGEFQFYLSTMLNPNDRVQIVSPQVNTSFTIPTMTGQIDLAHGLLSGTGPSNGQLSVWQWTGQLPYYGGAIKSLGTLNINAMGQYSLTLPPSVLAAGSSLNLATRYQINEIVQVWHSILVNPIQWRVTLDDGSISGNLPEGSNAITLTLRKANNLSNEIVADEFYTNPISFIGRFHTMLETGDVLVLQTNTGNYTFTLPLLTATYGAAPTTGMPIFSGTSEPNAQIQVNFNEVMGMYYASAVQRNATSDTNGHYGIDVSDIRPKLYSQVQVIYVDELNNTIQRNLSAVLMRLPFPIVMRD